MVKLVLHATDVYWFIFMMMMIIIVILIIRHFHQANIAKNHNLRIKMYYFYTDDKCHRKYGKNAACLCKEKQ